MISITADVQPEPGGRQRVNVYAGPADHQAFAGGLVMPSPAAAELVARLRAPEHHITDHITPDIAAAVLHHRGDIGGRRPADDWTPLLIAAIEAAPPEDRLLLRQVYPGHVDAVLLATGTEPMVRTLRDMAAGVLPPAREPVMETCGAPEQDGDA